MDDLKALLDIMKNDPNEPLARFIAGGAVIMELKDKDELPMQFKNVQMPMTFCGLPLAYDENINHNELVGISKWDTRILTIICGGMK